MVRTGCEVKVHGKMFEGTRFLFRLLMGCTQAAWTRVVKKRSTTLSSTCGNTIRPSDRVCTT